MKCIVCGKHTDLRRFCSDRKRVICCNPSWHEIYEAIFKDHAEKGVEMWEVTRTVPMLPSWRDAGKTFVYKVRADHDLKEIEKFLSEEEKTEVMRFWY